MKLFGLRFAEKITTQPSSDEKEKQCWLEKFDCLIAEVYVKWNGMIIIAGDFNINLNSDSGKST